MATSFFAETEAFTMLPLVPKFLFQAILFSEMEGDEVEICLHVWNELINGADKKQNAIKFGKDPRRLAFILYLV